MIYKMIKRDRQDVDRDFELLKRRISIDRGFNCSNYKDGTLKRRIKTRMNANNIDSYREYDRFLIGNDGEYEKLMDALTVNVTKFFRDISMYHKFREEILPELINRKLIEKRRVVRIWSAGCASGEEPYSIAIVLCDYLKERLDNFLIFIHGTDIDDKSLEIAKEGIYPLENFEDMPSDYIKRYFDPCKGGYRVRDNIGGLIKFHKDDLITGKKLRFLDIILCRNVFIYFSRETQEQILENFYNALNPGGYLIIGKSETMTQRVSKKFELIDLSERIYRKPLPTSIKPPS